MPFFLIFIESHSCCFKACSRMPGLIYIALGDPLQKRNYYRTGWLRFREDADMTAVMAELSEKKVTHSFLCLQSLQSNPGSD